MKIIKKNDAVSEIIGTALLLAIAVAVMSVVYMQVLSEPSPSDTLAVTLVGKVENGDVAIEHRGGEALSLDSEVLLTIAGAETVRKTAGELLGSDSFVNDRWHIGERLIYDERDITGLQVKVRVVDATTNALVLWGILQEGYVVPPGGRGGIWHFDEVYWDGTPEEVRDSSGNENHGSARDEANTIDSSMSGRAGFFDGIDDYALVKGNKPGLYITNEITIEAWMKSEQRAFAVEDRNFGASFSYDPDIIHISDDVYAIASGTGHMVHEGVLYTVKIAADGHMTDITNNNSLTYETREAYRPNIIGVSNSSDVYAIVYEDHGNPPNGYIKTVTITPDGSTSDTGVKRWFVDAACKWPKIVRVSDSIYAVAYTSWDNDGFLKTVTITANGSISNTASLKWEFDTVSCFEPNIIHVSGDVYAIAYRGEDNDGFLKTVAIASDGSISDTGTPKWEFDTVSCFEPNIIHVSGDVYAITYRGEDNDGFLKTVAIASDGVVTDISDNSSYEFVMSDCYMPKIVNVSDSIFTIVYTTKASGTPIGVLVSVEIKSDGSITDRTIILDDSIGPNKCFEPDIIHVSNRICAIAYRAQTPHPGFISTAVVGDDPTSPFNRGIVKEGSYGLYTNSTLAFAFINKPEDVKFSIPIKPGWNHITLTYDGVTVRLYRNGSEITSTTYNKPITTNSNSLYFGKLFRGIIDEVAIYDRALTHSEVQYHYTNPGSLEMI